MYVLGKKNIVDDLERASTSNEHGPRDTEVTRPPRSHIASLKSLEFIKMPSVIPNTSSRSQ